MKNLKNYIKDMRTGKKVKLKWVGYWSADRIRGCAISFEDVPRMELYVDQIYHIVFESKMGKIPHSINGFFKLWGIDYIDTRNNKFKKYLKLSSVDPLTACELIHKEKE